MTPVRQRCCLPLRAPDLARQGQASIDQPFRLDEVAGLAVGHPQAVALSGLDVGVVQAASHLQGAFEGAGCGRDVVLLEHHDANPVQGVDDPAALDTTRDLDRALEPPAALGDITEPVPVRSHGCEEPEAALDAFVSVVGVVPQAPVKGCPDVLLDALHAVQCRHLSGPVQQLADVGSDLGAPPGVLEMNRVRLSGGVESLSSEGADRLQHGDPWLSVPGVHDLDETGVGKAGHRVEDVEFVSRHPLERGNHTCWRRRSTGGTSAGQEDPVGRSSRRWCLRAIAVGPYDPRP